MRGQPIPLFIPEIVSYDKLVPYLKQVDENKWYSNRGPLACSFEKRLEEHFDYPAGGIITCSSGTLAITSTLLALELPRGSKCVMPAWTFVGTMAAINAAGLEPALVDVDLESWALDINEVKKFVEADKEVSAIIVVCPFGKMVDIALWEDFSESYNIPVIIDGAACFDSFKQVGKKTKLPFIISLHATKVFGIGEGGLVLSENTALIDKVKRMTNFGIDENRNVPVIGINAKMSEYHAAVGHAMLENWIEIKLRWERINQVALKFLEKNKVKSNLSKCSVSSMLTLYIDRENFHCSSLTHKWYSVNLLQLTKNYNESDFKNSILMYENTYSLPFYLGLKDRLTEKSLSALFEVG